MLIKLLNEHLLEFLSLKGGCRGSSESTPVKMSNCWKSHAAAQLLFITVTVFVRIEIKNVISHVTLRGVLSVWMKLGLEIKYYLLLCNIESILSDHSSIILNGKRILYSGFNFLISSSSKCDSRYIKFCTYIFIIFL